MNARRSIMIGAVVGAAGIAGGVFIGKSVRLPRAADARPAPSGELAELANAQAAELAAMRNELRAQRAQQAMQYATIETRVNALKAGDAHAADADEPEPEPPTAEEKAAQAKELLERQRERETAQQRALQTTFQAAFDSEPVDSGWSRSKREAIRSALGGDLAAPGVSLSQLDCRTSLCRAEVKLEGEGARAALDTALEQPAFAGGSYFHPGPTEGSTVIYAFREDRQDAINRIFKNANTAYSATRSSDER